MGAAALCKINCTQMIQQANGTTRVFQWKLSVPSNIRALLPHYLKLCTMWNAHERYRTSYTLWVTQNALCTAVLIRGTASKLSRILIRLSMCTWFGWQHCDCLRFSIIEHFEGMSDFLSDFWVFEFWQNIPMRISTVKFELKWKKKWINWQIIFENHFFSARNLKNSSCLCH